MSKFIITHKDSKTKARLGVLNTPHGKILTPSYVFVGTYGKFRHLTPKDIKKTKTQLVIANTFHLWQKALNSKHEIRNKSKIKNSNNKTLLMEGFGKMPTMTDSGGFQILSLAFGDKNRIGKFITGDTPVDNRLAKSVIHRRKNIKITEKGVYFSYNGKKLFLGPELSIKLQKKIGADIIFAFDHITSPLDNYSYNKKAVELTDKWAKISVKCKVRNEKLNGKHQMLFGIVQGGLFKNLRIKSAKSIGSLPFDGFGIGGSYTKKQISKILKWVIPYLPEEKPRHLLGVGKVADIFEAVQNGIDMFDCVIPTREARHGRLYTKNGHIDIRKGKYANDTKIIEKGCGCPACVMKGTLDDECALHSRSVIRRLIKSKDKSQNAAGQRWCLTHNMWFFNNLLEEIRWSIQRGKFTEFKKKYLKNFNYL